MTTPTFPQPEGLRRIRSDGDMVPRPERAYMPSHLRTTTTLSDSQDASQLHYLPLFQSPGGHSSPTLGPPPAVPTPTNPPLHHQGAAPLADPPAHTQHTTSASVRILAYFGIGRRASHARKAFVSMVWHMAWGCFQFVIIMTMLILTGTLFKSTQDPGISEWTACDRPLGVWASLWLLRVILATGLSYWEYLRDRILHPSRSDPETGHAGHANDAPTVQGMNSATGPFGQTNHAENGMRTHNQLPEPPSLPHSALYSRLTLLSSLMTLSWFLTAHILEYTSINTCRHTSPHLWWLMFGILCIMYLMVLEVLLLGFVVLIIAPILFILWNIILICIGRHPIQNPNMIKPEIGKLPKSVVDRIPLVNYIPPPPSDSNPEGGERSPHIYPPPKSLQLEATPTQNRFKLLRNLSSFGTRKPTDTLTNIIAESSNPDIDSWRDNWEQGEYPLITLEGNRASCAICLMDFEEPKRKNIIGDEVEKGEVNENAEIAEPLSGNDNDTGGPSNLNKTSRSVPISEDNQQGDLKLADAGDGAQPLRLLDCGHVFHKTCLDPWLTDISGRCPVCQRPVEASKTPLRN